MQLLKFFSTLNNHGVLVITSVCDLKLILRAQALFVSKLYNGLIDTCLSCHKHKYIMSCIKTILFALIFHV